MSATTCTDCGTDLHKAAEIAAGVCVRCYDDDQFDAEMAELANEPEYRTCRHCGSGPMMIAPDDKRCRFCRAAEVRAAEMAITHGAATVAVEDEIDEREDRANDRAEREEEREAAEAEWAAEQGEEIEVEVEHA